MTIKSPSDPRYWSTLLGLPKANFVLGLKPEVDDYAKALIWVQAKTSGRELNQTKANRETMQSFGLRFGLYMTAVYLNISPTENASKQNMIQMSLRL